MNQTCATFVQVLHTDVQRYGTSKLLGDSDFFVNERYNNQPGCLHNYCDHTKAIYYYYASIFPQYGFVGSDCDQICSYPRCRSRFGLYNDGISGEFCFDVAACFPYVLQTLPTIITTTTAATTTTTVAYFYPPPPPLPPPLPPKRHKKRKHRRRKRKRCQQPCRKNCKQNCKCCSHTLLTVNISHN